MTQNPETGQQDHSLPDLSWVSETLSISRVPPKAVAHSCSTDSSESTYTVQGHAFRPQPFPTLSGGRPWEPSPFPGDTSVTSAGASLGRGELKTGAKLWEEPEWKVAASINIVYFRFTREILMYLKHNSKAECAGPLIPAPRRQRQADL